MRNENQKFIFNIISGCIVLTVPMRNGNSFQTLSIYRLKIVLTVPMRNGNTGWPQWLGKSRVSFLPYLWGMETSIDHITSNFRNSVLTVPMRNGNFLKRVLILQLPTVLTVPMRNGNLDRPYNKQFQKFSSYRTYEEWKLSQTCSNSTIANSSYRTYEEWKPR